MKNIVLIGMMGCGKTTLSAMLAQQLGRTVVDTDALIVEQEGRSIPEIFAADGEDYFRELEQSVAEKLAAQQGLIIACGGGLPLRPASIQPLRQSGLVIWLRRDPGETCDTMDRSGRPLAQQGKQDFLDRFAQREPIYRAAAHYIINDFSTPQATMNKILEALL